MDITLDQVRALEAVARLGSFAAAGRELRRVHTAVLYAVKQLEAALGLAVVDRSGYRASLTPFGVRVLEHGRRMLEVERELVGWSEVARAGYEPSLSIVYDGLLPARPILAAVRAAQQRSPHTRLSLFSEYLGDVEAKARDVGATVVLAVVPLEHGLAEAIPLAPLSSVLVAGRGHPLARAKSVTARALAEHAFLTVRGSDKRLRMSTSELDKPSALLLSDFQAKKVALLEGMGWGWMPEYLVSEELRRGQLEVLRWAGGRHVFAPVMHLGVRAEALGPAAEAFVAAIRHALLDAKGSARRSTAQPIASGKVPAPRATAPPGASQSKSSNAKPPKAKAGVRRAAR